MPDGGGTVVVVGSVFQQRTYYIIVQADVCFAMGPLFHRIQIEQRGLVVPFQLPIVALVERHPLVMGAELLVFIVLRQGFHLNGVQQPVGVAHQRLVGVGVAFP